MATNPNDRMALNPGERPISTDINQLQSNNQRSLMWLAQALVKEFSGANPAAAVFVADGFSLTAPGGTMNVTLNPGLGFYYNPSDVPTGIGGLSGVDDVSPLHPLPLATAQTIAVPAADPSNPRIDIIEVTTDRRLEQPQSRDILNSGTGVVTPASVNKVLAFYLDGREGAPSTGASTTGIGYKKGTPAGSPTAPAATSGYTVVCQILVPAAATQIVQGNVTDVRIPAIPHGTPTAHLRLDLVADAAVGITADSADHKFATFTSARAINSRPNIFTNDGVGAITVLVTGLYRIAGNMNVFETTGSTALLFLTQKVRKNGTAIAVLAQTNYDNNSAGGPSLRQISNGGEVILQLNAGDVVEHVYNLITSAGTTFQMLNASLTVQKVS